MGETFVGVNAHGSREKWQQRKSYTEVIIRILILPYRIISDRGEIVHRMMMFPRWSNLKHFNNVTTTHFTDGQAFYDILKVCTDFLAS
jgi:hypothetical protein